jgi:hypothetical protein
MTPLAAALFGVLLTIAVLWLRTGFASFRAQRPSYYADKGPQFDPRQHLSGPILCEGVIYGPTGRVTSRFVADMNGTWDGNSGVLSETFRYDSGTVQNRAWTMQLDNDGAIEATADDVLGTASGRAQGCGVVMRYRIRLAPEAGSHILDVTDWMYLMENGTIMNRSQFTKFGIQVAELVATMRRIPVQEPVT